RFRIGRRSEQIGAWSDELNKLRQIDRTTSSGAALHIASRQSVYQALANRIVPTTIWQCFGFFSASILAAAMSAIMFWFVETTDALMLDVMRYIIGGIYAVFTLLMLVLFFMRPRASHKIRSAVLSGIEAGEDTDPGAKFRLQDNTRILMRCKDEEPWSQIFSYVQSKSDKPRRKVFSWFKKKNQRAGRSKTETRDHSNAFKWHISFGADPAVRAGAFSFLRDVYAQGLFPEDLPASDNGGSSESQSSIDIRNDADATSKSASANSPNKDF